MCTGAQPRALLGDSEGRGGILDAGAFQVMEEHHTILPGGLERNTKIILYRLFHMSSKR